MQRKQLVVWLATMMLTGATIAQDTRPAPQGGEEGRGRGGRGGFSLEQLDANGDGKVAKDEFQGRAEIFDRLDGDKDGSITAEEFSAIRERMGGGGQRGNEGREAFDPSRLQDMMLDRLKERLGASDEEWTVLKPQLQKVTELQTQLRASAGPMASFGGRGGDRGPGGGDRGPGGGDRGGDRMMAPAPAMPEAETLRNTLDDENAAPEAITSALKAFRDARAAKQAELTKAQEDLRKVLTVRQEAILVMSGTLE